MRVGRVVVGRLMLVPRRRPEWAEEGPAGSQREEEDGAMLKEQQQEQGVLGRTC